MNERETVRVSRFLSLVLRHDPGRIGIELDSAGWVGVEELLAAMKRHRFSLSRADLDQVVATNSKKRFAYSEDGTRIRASQGHSIDVELGLEPVEPPPVLYHGTAERFLGSILTGGLKAMSRQQVHLSADEVTARVVGKRHGSPAILTVDCAAMRRDGALFTRSANGVWLVDAVPPKYLKRL